MTSKADATRSPLGRNENPHDYENFIPIRIRKLADAFQEIAGLVLSGLQGVRFTDSRILAYLTKRNGSSVADISRDLQIDKAWISRLLRELSDRKLVVRSRDPTDSRSVLVTLTDTGRALHDEVMEIVLRHHDTIMAGIDQTAAITFLDRLETNVATVISTLHGQSRGMDGRRATLQER